MSDPISEINTIITKEYLQTQREGQYFERKGLGEKDIKPTKIAEELIGMLNADGGTLAFGVSDTREIQDFSTYTGINIKTIRTYLNEFTDKNVMERLSSKLRDIDAVYVFKKF